MPNTYSKIILQYVFAVKGRENLILPSFREELQKVMCGLVTYKGAKPLSIYAMPDHVHLLVGIKPSMGIDELIKHVKTGSNQFINDNKLTAAKFSWQEGYGVFSYSRPQIPIIVRYIENQRTHHHTLSFREEYLAFLEKFEVEYEDKYLFEFYV